ncbi:3-hydroxy-9,10-secoandrosta-1,3,5(10)-triene-9, 17-dione monooxygenase reductase component [Thermoflexales bacterium]|nr:3-hydroxy-9,10-secoandrosta-1,3,5(10)-triene-9, 17-dione monooxygenase reductase component [Thermoflexales bacterium]
MDNALKKTVLRLFTYGLYAATTKQGDDVGVMTVNWLTQCSFDPPLLALAVEADSHSRQVIEASGTFALNLYESGQRELAGSLGRTFRKHPEKITEVAWQPGPATGSPLLENALGWVECKVTSSLPTGDHILFVAEVVEAGLNREGVPLTLKETGFKYAG